MKRIWPSLLLLVSSMMIGAVILEGVVRWKFGAPWPEQLPLVRVIPDPDTGWVMVPGDRHYTYHHMVQLNGHGFRGPEIIDKNEDEYRILALGDSHIYGQGMADRELLTTVMERHLNRPGESCSFRVINSGVRAYSINNQLALLKKFGMALHPDHVILFFYLNDFQEQNIEREYRKFAGTDWYTFDFAGKPTENTVRKWELVQMLRTSAFIMLAYDVYTAFINKENIENRILKGATDARVEERVRFVQNTLDEFVRFSTAHDIVFTLAAIPAPPQGVDDYPNERYQSTLSEYARQRSFDYVDLLPVLRKYYQDVGRLPIIPYDGHYDADGHHAFGLAMSDYLGDREIRCGKTS